MSNIVFVLHFMVMFFLMSKEYMSILLWAMSIMMFEMSYYYGNERIYLEIIEDYPIESCMKPRYLKFLFKRLNKLSYKDIPKEMYYGELIQACGFVIYSVVLMSLIFVSEYLSCLIGVIYIICVSILSLATGVIMEKKRFYARYKKLNRHNFKYLFWLENEPYPKKIGTCKIIGEQKWGKSVFVTIFVIETGEIKEKVLLQGKKRTGREPIYSLYEICRVYYIV